MARYVGLDAHSKRCVYVIQDENGKGMGEGNVPTDLVGLLAWRNRHELPAGTPVALESGTVAFRVARMLSGMGFEPRVIDAHEVRQKALRPNQKSDRRDALELCEGLRRDLYRTRVHVPPEAIEQLRETLRRRRHFVRLKVMQVNAVKHLFRAALCPLPVRFLGTGRAWDRLLAAMAVEPARLAFCQAHRAVWQCAHDQIRALEASLERQGEPFRRDLDRLQAVPGVGPIVAHTVLAVFSDARRFPSAKHAASYAGLVASSYDSGERVQHGHITRRGSSELRSMLCEAAHHARRPDHPLNPYFFSLLARRGYKMAVVAVAHRLCRILYAMLRDGTDFDVKRIAVEEGRFEHVTVRRYRRKKDAEVPA
jgi:transposase